MRPTSCRALEGLPRCAGVVLAFWSGVALADGESPTHGRMVVHVRCERVSEEEAAELRVRLRLDAEVLALTDGHLSLECSGDRLFATWAVGDEAPHFVEARDRTSAKEVLYELGGRLLRGEGGLVVESTEVPASEPRPSEAARGARLPGNQSDDESRRSSEGSGFFTEVSVQYRTLGSVSPGAAGGAIGVSRRFKAPFGVGIETPLAVGIRLPDGVELLTLGARAFAEWRGRPWLDVRLGPELSAFAFSGARLAPSTEWSLAPVLFARATVTPAASGSGWAFGVGAGLVGVERRVAIDAVPSFSLPLWNLELSISYRSKMGD